MPFRILSRGNISGQVNYLATIINNPDDVVALVKDFNEKHGHVVMFWFQDVNEPVPADAVEIAAKIYGRVTGFDDPIWDEEE